MVFLFDLSSMFQFTHPVRGATKGTAIQRYPLTVSIHAPRAGCDILKETATGREIVSIHAPRAGCDGRNGSRQNTTQVSIHAPRAGCDTRAYRSAVPC